MQKVLLRVTGEMFGHKLKKMSFLDKKILISANIATGGIKMATKKIKMSELKKIIKEELEQAMQGEGYPTGPAPGGKGAVGTVRQLIDAAKMYFTKGTDSLRILVDEVSPNLQVKVVDGTTMESQPGAGGALEKGLDEKDVVYIIAADGSIKTIAYVPKTEVKSGLKY